MATAAVLGPGGEKTWIQLSDDMMAQHLRDEAVVKLPSVRAQDLTDNDKETIKTYFEKKTESGGGKCGKIEMTGGNIFKICFKKKKDHKRVLQTKYHHVTLSSGRLCLSVTSNPNELPPSVPIRKDITVEEKTFKLVEEEFIRERHASYPEVKIHISSPKIILEGPDQQVYSAAKKLDELMNKHVWAEQQSISISSFDEISMTVGVGVKLTLVFGDITNETTDAIVNTTDFVNFDEDGVCRDILDVAGPEIEAQLQEATVNQGEIFVTQPGSFPCKAILHVCGQRDAAVIEQLACKIIQHCETTKLQSVAIPAICAGAGEMDPDVVADAILQGIKTAISSTPLFCLTDIRLVLFNINVFLASKEKAMELFPAAVINRDVTVHWDNMTPTETIKVVLLHPSSAEYQTVKRDFEQTVTNIVTKIERVQNIHLRRAYEAHKKQMSDKNKLEGGARERFLYHGTSQDNCSSIMKTGFNRSFAGQNAASYGEGTYFAVDASYSADPTYSTPAADGSQSVFLARVLTGTYTLGFSGMRMPPPHNDQQPDDRYDSLVDYLDNPSLYVVFHDSQAYPDYLITFI